MLRGKIILLVLQQTAIGTSKALTFWIGRTMLNYGQFSKWRTWAVDENLSFVAGGQFICLVKYIFGVTMKG